MEKGCEFLRRCHRRRNVVCAFVRVEAGQDRHAVPFSRVPGVDRSLFDEIAVNNGLEGPANTGIVSIENGKRGAGYGLWRLTTKAGHYLGGRAVRASSFLDELLELLLV